MSTAKPDVKINLDKERTLRLDLNGMAAFEQATGKNLLNAELQKNLGATELRALLWACLVHEDESLTLKQVGAWITTDNMEEVAGKLNEAFTNAVGKPKAGETADPLPTRPNG